MHPMQTIVAKQKKGEPVGIYSCCSANEIVLKAAILRAKMHHTQVLIEATANQVNQFGGYTGMKPEDFYKYVIRLAKELDFPEDSLILGGDHLGPLTWTELSEKEAMKNAAELIRQYVLAGFTKIHIDTSMRVADDDMNTRLSDETIAGRGTFLCKIAEEAYQERLTAHPDASAPVYVIGSEVPIPGGAQEDEDSISVTKPEMCRNTYQAFKTAFLNEGLDQAWDRVIGIVVQPGVEYGDKEVFLYNREAAKDLMEALYDLPVVFEGHSTDYQTPECLRQMVEDGVAILKVGPALTFALREALFAIENIEKELVHGKELSAFRETLEQAMCADPKYWKKYYRGTEEELKVTRAFSFSDRCRYYLPQQSVSEAINRLFENLKGVDIPPVLISQYMPMQYARVHLNRIRPDAMELCLDKIGDCIDEYLYATLVPHWDTAHDLL